MSLPFAEVFLEEAVDLLAALETGLLAMDAGDVSPDTVNAVFRAAHSMKGSAATVGFAEVARYVHGIENVLDRVRKRDLEMSRALGELLLRATDTLGALVDAVRAGEPPPDVEPLVRELARASGQAAPDPPREPPTRFDVVFRPAADFTARGLDAVAHLRELHEAANVERIALDPSALPPLEALDPAVDALSWTARVEAPHAESLQFVFVLADRPGEVELRPVADERPAPRPKAAGPASASLRVSTEKVDRIVDLVSEMVIAQAVIADAVRGTSAARIPRVAEALAQLDRDTRELQERVLGIRMVPIETIFSRVTRAVRDASAALGKVVQLDLVGGDTELDRGVIERVTDPLLHLVRNAIDHGVETPERRTAAGKPVAGTLRVAARHQGGNIVIEVADDGAGLDLERIRRKGVERGLLTDGQVYPKEVLEALILAPGFSTAAAVTDLSGRGVGMDVVRQNVEALNGTLAIDSRAGRGTTFRLTLPLTLTIVDGLLLEVSGEVYVLPLLSVVEFLRVRDGMICGALGGGEFLAVRGASMPLLRLRERLGRTEPPGPRPVVVVADTEQGPIGLLADGVAGQGQFVVKNLEAHFKRVDGLAGATILGDGRVGLILDVNALARRGRRAVASPNRPSAP